jgi:hypothetical protein
MPKWCARKHANASHVLALKLNVNALVNATTELIYVEALIRELQVSFKETSCL